GLWMVLDAAQNPHIAYNASNSLGIGYAICTGHCNSSPVWTQTQVVADGDMDKADPIPTAANCSTSGWQYYGRVTLALSPTGSAAISVDAEHVQGGSCTAQGDAWAIYLQFVGSP